MTSMKYYFKKRNLNTRLIEPKTLPFKIPLPKAESKIENNLREGKMILISQNIIKIQCKKRKGKKIKY